MVSLRIHDARRGAFLGLAAGLVTGTFAGTGYGAWWMYAKAYLPAVLPDVGLHLLLYPLGFSVPAGLVLGGVAGLILGLAGDRRRIAAAAVAALAAWTAAWTGRELLFFWLKLPLGPALWAAVAAAGPAAATVVWVAWRPLAGTFRAVPWRAAGAACGVLVMALWLRGLLGHPADRLLPHGTCGPDRFIELFDRGAPGMEPVFRAADAGDLEAALDALVEHFRTRSLPAGLWDLPPADEASLARAGDALEHRFRLAGTERREGERIDWDGASVSDKEWGYHLNRHHHWTDLARAWQVTGDPACAREVAAELKDWVARTEPVRWKRDYTTMTWRLLECGIRLRETWLQTAAALRGDPALDREWWIAFLGAVHDQAQLLAHFRAEANHLLTESGGLLAASVHFPEFRRSRQWTRIAMARLVQQVQVQVYPDGVHLELSPDYHLLAMSEFDRALQLARSSGVAVPEDFEVPLRAMWEYVAAMVQPDGYLPNLNDGELEHLAVADALATAGRRLGRPDLVYAATGGREGERPTWTSRLFPDAGQAVMRTGWGTDDLLLVFDGGAYGGAHGHEDKLSITCYGYGAPLVADPGRYTHDVSDPYRVYFATTAGHNTVMVDGKSQVRVRLRESYDFVPAPAPWWAAGDAAEYVEASYNDGYADPRDWGQAPDLSVRHVRGVLFLKPDGWLVLDRLEGRGAHQVTRLFHLPPVQARVDGSWVETIGDAGRLALKDLAGRAPAIVEGAQDPIQGWFSRRYNQKEPAPCVVLDGQVVLPASFATLLAPFRGEVRPSFDVGDVQALPGGGLALSLVWPADDGSARNGPAREDLVVWPASGGGAWTWRGLAGEGDVRVALVRLGEPAEPGADRVVTGGFVAGTGRVRYRGADLPGNSGPSRR